MVRMPFKAGDRVPEDFVKQGITREDIFDNPEDYEDLSDQQIIDNVYAFEKDENLTGQVCVNSLGQRGIVIGKREFHWGVSWIGFALDGSGTWASRSPAVLGTAIEVHDRLSEKHRGSDFSQRTDPKEKPENWSVEKREQLEEDFQKLAAIAYAYTMGHR